MDAFGGHIIISEDTIDYINVLGAYHLAEYYREHEDYQKAFNFYKITINEYENGASISIKELEDCIVINF